MRGQVPGHFFYSLPKNKKEKQAYLPTLLKYAILISLLAVTYPVIFQGFGEHDLRTAIILGIVGLVILALYQRFKRAPCPKCQKKLWPHLLDIKKQDRGHLPSSDRVHGKVLEIGESMTIIAAETGLCYRVKVVTYACEACQLYFFSEPGRLQQIGATPIDAQAYVHRHEKLSNRFTDQ